MSTTHTTTTPASAPADVVRRAYRYAGCSDYVLRWFVATDAVPRPYLTEAEARAELLRRSATA